MRDPVVLRERYYTQPLKIKLPKLPDPQGGNRIVVPVIVDWFDLPDWYYFANPLDYIPADEPYYFNPNMISVEIAR